MIKVAKFGGSSLSSAENIKKAADIVLSDRDRKYIVVSAPGKLKQQEKKDAACEEGLENEKITDLLYRAYYEINNKKNNERNSDLLFKIKARFQGIIEELGVSLDINSLFDGINGDVCEDYLVSRGEYICGKIFSQYIGYEFIDAAEVIFFDQKGDLDLIKTALVLGKRLEKTSRAVIPGFYGAMPDGRIKTFSRGGSDISGAILAYAAHADIYENWSDVNGFMLADPEIVGENKTVSRISYRQLQALSKMGAEIIHPSAVAPVCRGGIPINIKNTFSPEKEGTLIEYSEECCEEVSGITVKKGLCTFVAEDYLPPLSTLLSVFSRHNVEIEQIQVCGGDVMITANKRSLKNGKREILYELGRRDGCSYVINDTAILYIQANALNRGLGMAERVFYSLKENNISIKTTAVCHKNGSLTALIDQSKTNDVIKTVYKTLQKND